MAPNRGSNRQREFEDFVQPGAKDFDPEEDDVPQDSEEDSDLEQEDDGFDGREHYESVGKSKLRKSKEVALGPQYRGAKIGREEIEDESEEEDFLARGFGEGSSEEEDEDDGSEEEDEEELLDGTDDTNIIDEEEEVSHKPNLLRQDELAKLQAQVKDLGNESGQKAGSRTLSQATQDEAEKGRAIKRQRTTFDSLLNTRMKLQKSLITANTLVGTPAEQIDSERNDAQQALEAAETAALTLWQSLNNFREDLQAARTGEKRKRSKFSVETPTEDLWEHVQSQEKQSRKERDAVLKKWWTKTNEAVTTQTARLKKPSAQATIVEIIEEQLSDDRLINRAHLPRSCAPLQASQPVNEDPKIYDDADFYGLLLKELLEQKSQDSVAASNIDLGFQMRREAKTKRNVDTKASKGRKLRYTAHQKLENFMAPEDRTKWGERQADDLFGSLFGQRLGLGEKEEEEEEMEEDGVDAEEAGLLMFRS